MLVLVRREQEQIVIGNGEIIITVISMKGNQVKLGIDAPTELPINRREVYEKMKRRGEI